MQVLVVAGGADGPYASDRLSSVEVLEHGATSWVAGPELPRWGRGVRGLGGVN